MVEVGRTNSEAWLVGGGEMGALLRSQLAQVTDNDDRPHSSLDAIDIGSPSLKNALGIMLNADCPMFLIWGHDRRLFYNDACYSLLNESNLLMPLGESVNEAWNGVRSKVEQVFASGQPLQRDDDVFPANQNGHASNWKYTWFYSALWDETGQVGGVVATGCKTTVPESVTVSTEQQSLQQAKAALRESEARFQAFMCHSPAAAWIADQEGRLLYLSPTYFQMFQVPQRDVVGKPIQEVYGEEFAQQFLENNRRVFETGQVVETVEAAPRPDGNIGSFLVYKFPIIQEAEPTLLGGVAIDITEHKQIEAALMAQEQRYRYIFEAVNIAIWEEDFSEVKGAIAQLKAAGVEDFCQYFADHPEFVQQAISMVRLRDVNQAALHMFKASSKAELLTSLGQIFVPETQAIFIEELLAIAAEAPSFAGETVVQTLQGDRLTVWVTITFPAASESYDRVIVSLLDMTERKHAEIALAESEERFRNMADNAPVMIWVTDPTGYCTYLSQSWYEFTGQTEETGLGFGWLSAVYPEDSETSEAIFLGANSRHEAFQLEYQLRRKDGEYRWAIDTANPWFGIDGEFKGYIGSVIDMSDRKRVEVEREQVLLREQAAREAAEHANRIKDEFLAVLSHELRSPLNPILGWAKLLQSREFDQISLKKALATIERNASLQAQLIEDLLDTSRILQGKLNLNWMEINLASVIEAAMETVRLAAEAKGIQIQTRLDSTTGKVLGDPARLQQIVWNLLTNAIKFTPEGGRVEVKLESYEFSGLSSQLEDSTQNSELKTQNLQNYAQITVTDTGKGISPDFLPHVFGYFRQADASTTRTFGGLGLGLAIVHHLVQLHGGSVEATSPGEGQGATFTVQFPLIKANRLVSNATVADTTVTPSIHPPLMGVQVLVVDDDQDTREFYQFVLEQAGAIVTTTTSATEALQTLALAKPDILLSDIGMPEFDGYMLIQQIRAGEIAQGAAKPIPAIALTAYAGEINQQQALATGFQHHLAKPVPPETLIEAIVNFVKTP